MAIAKSAVDAYLKRNLKTFEWMKSLPEDKIDGYYRKLPTRPRFFTHPFKHQRICFLIGAYYPEFLFFLDMGLGKTKIILDLLAYRKQNGTKIVSLVLVPNVVNIQTWIDETATHQPELNCCPLLGTTAQRTDLLDNTDADLYVINYAGLLYLISSKIKDPKTKKNKMTLDPAKVEWLQEKINAIVMDESQALKSHRSETFRACVAMGAKCEVRYALTGTPFGRDPQDLWSQFYANDKGETLGSTLGIFRAAFFKQKINYWGGYEYTVKAASKKDIHRVIQHRSIEYSSDECMDMPQKHYVTMRLPFPDANKVFYDKVVQDVVKAAKDVKLMQNSFLRMRQICSGFIGLDEGGTKIKVEMPVNPKLDALEELIDEMPPNAKMVIFHEYIYSGLKITNFLASKKLEHEHLWGNNKDPIASVNNFTKKKSCRFLVINSKSGSSGLNLQVANYVVFYESPVSSIVRAQAEKRCHRTGQKAKIVHYYDLVIANSIEEKILKYIEEGAELFKALVQGKELWTT